MKDNPIVYVLLVAFVLIGVILMFGMFQGNVAEAAMEDETVKAVDVVNIEELPTVKFGEDGEATVLDGGATANLMHTIMQEDDKEDEMYVSALLEMNAQHQETIQKNVRNLSWSPAVVVFSLALIVIGFVVLVAIMKKGNK